MSRHSQEKIKCAEGLNITHTHTHTHEAKVAQGSQSSFGANTPQTLEEEMTIHSSILA